MRCFWAYCLHEHINRSDSKAALWQTALSGSGSKQLIMQLKLEEEQSWTLRGSSAEHTTRWSRALMCRVLKTRQSSTTVSVSNTFCLCSIDGRSQNKPPLHFLVTRVTDDTKESVSQTFSTHARNENELLCGRWTWDVNIPVTSGAAVARRLCVCQVLRPENPLNTS